MKGGVLRNEFREVIGTDGTLQITVCTLAFTLDKIGIIRWFEQRSDMIWLLFMQDLGAVLRSSCRGIRVEAKMPWQRLGFRKER